MADRNTPVTVLVGDDKHPFHLNEQQLCACSPFFRSVLTDGFKETHERVVLLPASCYCTERSFLPCCMLANGIRRSLLPIFASSYLLIRQVGKGLGWATSVRHATKIRLHSLVQRRPVEFLLIGPRLFLQHSQWKNKSIMRGGETLSLADHFLSILAKHSHSHLPQSNSCRDEAAERKSRRFPSLGNVDSSANHKYILNYPYYNGASPPCLHPQPRASLTKASQPEMKTAPSS